MNFSEKIYFDNASTTQPFAEVAEEIAKTITEVYGNPSSTHSFGRVAKSMIENTRKNIAKELNVLPSEIVFTSGGTESNNLILRGCINYLGIQTFITSKIEHPAVLHTVEVLSKEHNIDLQYININSNGEIDLNHLEKTLEKTQNQKVLVSLMHVNNEIGNIFPIKNIGNLCKKYNAYFHSDMVQSVGHFKLNLSEMNIDFATASAHKFHGVKGVGFAYVRKTTGLRGFIFGGEQERGIRGGTEPLHNIIGMNVAFLKSYKELENNNLKIKQIKEYFIQEIKRTFPDVLFNGNSGSLKRSSHTIVNVAFPSLKEKSDTILFHLDLKGIACSRGSACQSGSVQTSHVLSAFLSDERLKIPALRFSFSHFNTKKEVDKLISVMQELSKN